MGHLPSHRGLFGLLMLATACGAEADPCLSGARICDGDQVLLCDPDRQTFVEELTCPSPLQCLAGECVPMAFSGQDVRGSVARDVPRTREHDAGPADINRPDGSTQNDDPSQPPQPADASTPRDTHGRVAQDAANGDDVQDARHLGELVDSGDPGDTAQLDSQVQDGAADLDVPVDEGEGDTPTPDEMDTAVAQEDSDIQGATEPDGIEPQSGDVEDDTSSGETQGEVLEDPYAPGMLVYQSVSHLQTGDIHRVRWHPSDAYALLLSADGDVLRYDRETHTVSLSMTLGSEVSDLDVAHDGGAFFIVGEDGDTSTVWRVSDAETDTPVTTVVATSTLGTFRAIVRHPTTDEFALGSSTGSGINYLFLWDEQTLGLVPVGFNGGDIYDLMWADVAATGGNRAVITSEGWGSIGSHTWYVDAMLVDSNGFFGGNPGGAAWQPGGGFGMLTGWSSNKLYVFDGTWETATLPGVGTAASPNRIAWRENGARALVVGRAIGPGLSATVSELRAGSQTTFDAITLVNASIPNFDDAPFFGDSNVHLLDADWRPGPCDGGLIVGTDSNASSFGKVIVFYDPTDAACQGWP